MTTLRSFHSVHTTKQPERRVRLDTSLKRIFNGGALGLVLPPTLQLRV